jgi:membrane-associated phospholipid phosphatase
MEIRPVDTGTQVRREAGLVARLAAGAGLGALVAIPFVLILALVVSESEWLERIDRGAADDLNRWALSRPGMVGVLEALEAVTAPWSFRIVVLVVAVLLWRARSVRLATWAVTTMAVGGLLNLAVKQLVERARPTFPEPVAFANDFSFPSGHAQNSMMGTAVLLLIVLPLLSPRGKVVAWAVGAVIVLVTGFDRIGLGVHFVSDVLAGWIMALAVVTGTTVAFGGPHRRHAPAEGIDVASSRRLQR